MGLALLGDVRVDPGSYRMVVPVIPPEQILIVVNGDHHRCIIKMTNAMNSCLWKEGRVTKDNDDGTSEVALHCKGH